MKKKFLSFFTLSQAYKKGIRGGSVFWRYGFFIGILFKILKWIFSKPAPEKIQEYELAPGEYKITVSENEKSRKKGE